MDIVFIGTAILFVVLIVRLFFMTIVEGDKYREIADNRRIKTIYDTAPRGEIRDRHGRLLAGNIPSFTVQMCIRDRYVDDGRLGSYGGHDCPYEAT